MVSFAAMQHRARRVLPALVQLSAAALLCTQLGAAHAQATAGQSAASAQHEQQLQAIRQALLESTLEKAPTRVVSSAWVDDKGTLHESHAFRSGAEVRGVRVLSYLQDEEAPRTRVSVDVLPWDLRPRGSASPACEPPARALRRPMATLMQLSLAVPGMQQAAALSVLSGAHQQLDQLLLQSGQWSPMAWQEPPASTYQRALLSSPGEDAHAWRATLSLHPAPQQPTALALPDSLVPWSQPAPWHWTLVMTITQRPAGSNAFQEVTRQQLSLVLDPQAMADHPQRGLQGMHRQVHAQLQQWLNQLHDRTRCESHQFVVRRQPDTSLQLQAGAASGLRAGDRVLLMQPGWVPSRLLDASALEHLALAEVVQTGQRLTQLRQLAGPAIAAPGEWVALPL